MSSDRALVEHSLSELSRKQLIVISTASSADLNTIEGALIIGKARRKGVAMN
jgi:hypothetical protein